jgi:hypothetical protein
MDEIAKLPDLGGIYLDNTGISNQGLEALAGLSRLYWLDISHSRITASGFATLKKFPGLQHLTLLFDNASADDCAPLAGLNLLRELIIYSGPASRNLAAGDCLKHIRGLDKLTKLVIYFPIRDEDAQCLSGLKKLESLELFGARQTGRGLMSNAGLQAILPCKSLKMLKIPGESKITAADVDGFEDMAELNYLDLNRCGITDEGLRRIAKLPALEYLQISNSAVTSKGLAALAGSKTLRTLFIDQTQVDDAGLKALETVKTLRAIYAVGSKIKQPAATRFMTNVPGSAVILKYENAAGGAGGVRSPGARDPSLPKTSTGAPGKP